jgi:hypothetical protein
MEITAFLSYARLTDQHDRGRVNVLCDLIEGEAEIQLGIKLRILRDSRNIEWGQSWHAFMSERVKTASYLLPIITEAYFQSRECQKEYLKFIEYEKSLNRSDLILPIYYAGIQTKIDDLTTQKWRDDIFSRQYFDWRPFRHEDSQSSKYTRAIEEIATRFRKVLERDARFSVKLPVNDSDLEPAHFNSKQEPEIPLPSIKASAPASDFADEICRLYHEMPETQKNVVKYIHRTMQRKEITVDELFHKLREKVDTKSPESPVELFYRLQVLELKGFVHLTRAGEKTTAVSPVKEVNAIGVSRKLWNS